MVVQRITTEAIPPTRQPTVWLPSHHQAEILVRVGSLRERCRVKQSSSGKIHYASRHPQITTLNGMRLNIREGRYTLALGPLIGIFVSKGAVNSIIRGEPKFRLTEPARVNHNLYTLHYYFSIGDVDFSTRTISGHFYHNEREQWVSGELPFPDIWWDRGGGFLRKQRPIAQELRARFNRLPIPRINAQYHFSKWDTFDKLRTYKHIRPYLPHTVQFRDQEQIRLMLSRHGTIYVKNIYGSNGRSVMEVRLLPDGYQYAAFRDELLSGHTEDYSQLCSIIKQYFGNKPLVIQQGLNAVKYQGNKVDFRALMQRDEAGKWQLTAMPMRIAASGCPITSTASGSKVLPIWTGLTSYLGFSQSKALDYYNRFYTILKDIVLALEKEYGRFGELGIDMVLDEDGQIWFLECNSKPGKDTVVQAGIQEEIDLAFARPFQYAKYLSGFREGGD